MQSYDLKLTGLESVQMEYVTNCKIVTFYLGYLIIKNLLILYLKHLSISLTKKHSQKVTNMRGASPLTRAEVKSLLKVTKSIRERTLLTLGFSTAYRISSMLSLTVADVSTNGIVHNRITVQAKNTKTKVGHTVLLNSDAKKALQALLDWLKAKGIDDKTAPLFLSQKRTINGALKAISRIQAHRIIKDLFEQIGLLGKSYSTHSMRKTMAAYIYDMTGGKIEKVAAVLGHKSLNSTLAYLSFNNSDIDNALTALEF